MRVGLPRSTVVVDDDGEDNVDDVGEADRLRSSTESADSSTASSTDARRCLWDKR